MQSRQGDAPATHRAHPRSTHGPAPKAPAPHPHPRSHSLLLQCSMPCRPNSKLLMCLLTGITMHLWSCSKPKPKPSLSGYFLPLTPGAPTSAFLHQMQDTARYSRREDDMMTDTGQMPCCAFKAPVHFKELHCGLLPNHYFGVAQSVSNCIQCCLCGCLCNATLTYAQLLAVKQCLHIPLQTVAMMRTSSRTSTTITFNNRRTIPLKHIVA